MSFRANGIERTEYDITVHVDVLLVVCYIANEATLKQLDRHLEAY